MFRALWIMCWTEETESPMIFLMSSLLKICCKAFLSTSLQLEYHIDMQYENTVSTTPPVEGHLDAAQN